MCLKFLAMFGDSDSSSKLPIEHLVELMNKIEMYVRKITCKVNVLESHVNTVDSCNKELEGGLQGMDNLYDNVKKVCDKNKNDIAQVKSSVASMAKDNGNIRSDIELLRKEREELLAAATDLQCTDLQCRSMKNNFKCSGLAENIYENTQTVLRDFIYNELEINQDIEFVNVHIFDSEMATQDHS